MTTTKECACMRLRQADGLIHLAYGVSGAHPSPIQLIMETVQRESEKEKSFFASMLTPGSSGLISILLAQTLQECYCVSVSGASS